MIKSYKKKSRRQQPLLLPQLLVPRLSAHSNRQGHAENIPPRQLRRYLNYPDQCESNRSVFMSVRRAPQSQRNHSPSKEGKNCEFKEEDIFVRRQVWGGNKKSLNLYRVGQYLERMGSVLLTRRNSNIMKERQVDSKREKFQKEEGSKWKDELMGWQGREESHLLYQLPF